MSLTKGRLTKRSTFAWEDINWKRTFTFWHCPNHNDNYDDDGDFDDNDKKTYKFYDFWVEIYQIKGLLIVKKKGP